MKAGAEALPDDVEALKAALMVARAEAAAARAQQSDDQALIAHLKLQIEKLNRDRYVSAQSVPRGCWISLS
jgi:transposase